MIFYQNNREQKYLQKINKENCKNWTK